MPHCQEIEGIIISIVKRHVPFFLFFTTSERYNYFVIFIMAPI
jgi:hypothetical protein